MFYVYFLISRVNEDLYIGYCEDLRKRFEEHNSGKVKSTKGYKPWNLIGYEAYKEKLDATKRERFLKNHQQRDLLKARFKNSFGNK